MYKLEKVIGLGIEAIKTSREDKYPEYILFDDWKTYIELVPQDEVYSDCNEYARCIDIHEDSAEWSKLIQLSDTENSLN